MENETIKKDSLVYFQLKEKLGIPITEAEMEQMGQLQEQSDMGIQFANEAFDPDNSLDLLLATYPEAFSTGYGYSLFMDEAKQRAKDLELFSPKGKVVESINFPGDPNTTVNVKGKDVPSQSARVDIMDYGDAEKHPEQWENMEDFTDSKHYGDNDNPRKVDLSSKYNSEDDMPWYGPNAEFIVDDVNLENKYQGTSVRLSILDSDGNVTGKVELGHLTEINKDVFNQKDVESKYKTIFKPGTILGKTNRPIGCTTGPHLHMTNLRGDRNNLQRIMSGN